MELVTLPRTGNVRIVVTDGPGPRSRIRVAGELDVATGAALGQVVEDLRADARTVDVDLRDVTFADVTGMRPLWAAALDAGGTQVRIVTASPAVVRLLDVLLDLLAVRRGTCADGCADGRSSR